MSTLARGFSCRTLAGGTPAVPVKSLSFYQTASLTHELAGLSFDRYLLHLNI
jgi:hypothetical protein